VPERVLIEAATRSVQLRGFDPDQLLERRVRAAVGGAPTVADFVRSVSAPTPTPGGGSVAALAGALASALAGMVAGLTVGRPKYAAADATMREIGAQAVEHTSRLLALVDRDAAAYQAVVAAHKLPKTPAEPRRAAIAAALTAAADVPLETARACAQIADLAARAAESGNPNAVSDAGVSALLAEAAARGAAYNVRINVAAMDDPAAGLALAEEAQRLVADASRAAARATAEVEKRL
jgi:glutamate formiminotransferase/formiminotetrahydrofolate cyclodeaminase